MSTIEINLNNGTIIKEGDFLQLGDLMKDKFKLTKNYDINVDHPIEIHKYDNNDFKHVEIIPTPETDLNELPRKTKAHKLLSKVCDQIQSINCTSGKKFIYSNCFKVDIDDAILNKEIEILTCKIDLSKQEKDVDFIKEIQNCIELYSIGLFTLDELNEQLENMNYYYFQFIQKRWEVNYGQSLMGGFYKMEK